MTTAASARATYDLVAPAYDASSRGAFGDVYDHVTAWGIARVLPPPGARVLDVGGGTGLHAARLAAAGYRVTLVEPSEGMLRVARGRAGAAGVGIARGTLERLAVRDASVDFVLCEGDPLSYCRDAAEAGAREVLRVLAPGGRFYVSCDSRWFGALSFLASGRPREAFACADRGDSRDPYGLPVRAFAPAELRAIFEAAGAEEVDVGGKVCVAQLLPDEALAALWSDPEAGPRLRALEERLAADPSVAGVASHLVATGRKGGA
ncbi:MAG TPA: methyltransferase domain-containing protein [Candidatus Thermoplasmatota archaeon]|nr:methyltransferase domain-containing protein [Candidatus Thermoplasmatota archaeon]